MSIHARFATAINCMDGRVQQPAADWIKKKYGVDYVDAITEPGPNKILADNEDITYLESIRRRVDISVNKHGSSLIAILGHHDCAGNPADKENQLRQTKAAMKTIAGWGFSARIIGLWIDENWKVSQVE